MRGLIPAASGLGLSGRLRLTIVDPEGRPVRSAETSNLMCSAGLTVLAQTINWSGIADENQQMGSPFSYVDLTPIYGALGTGTAQPASSDVALGNEGARAVVAMAATVPSPAQFMWQFFFSTVQSAVTWTEAGVFVQASAASGAGSLLDHALFQTAVTQGAGQGALLQATFTLVAA